MLAVVSELPEAVAELAAAVAELPEAVAEFPLLVFDVTAALAELPEAVAELADAVAEFAEAVAELPELVALVAASTALVVVVVTLVAALSMVTMSALVGEMVRQPVSYWKKDVPSWVNAPVGNVTGLFISAIISYALVLIALFPLAIPKKSKTSEMSTLPSEFISPNV